MLRALVAVLTVISLTGCAISGFAKFENMNVREELDAVDGNTNTNIDVTIRCSEKIYSMMGSLIVPLPPIIPTFWINDGFGWISIRQRGPEQELLKVHVQDSNGSYSLVRVVGPFRHNETVISQYELPKSCADLDGGKVILIFGHPEGGSTFEKKFVLKYGGSHLGVHWFYLSA